MTPEARERAFDDLATQMASGSISRGKALRLMGAALLGGTLGSLGIRGASADEGDQGENEECKAAGRKCNKDKQCCSGNCTDDGTCAACPVDRVLLSNGTCAKPCTAFGIPSPECPNCFGCTFDISSPTGFFCSSSAVGSLTTCFDDSQCPSGEFCNTRGVGPGPPPRCRVAC